MAFKLPTELGDIEAVLDRSGDAWKEKALWENQLDEGFRFCAPQRNLFFGERDQIGEKKNQRVFDSTAVMALPKFASRAQSIIMPPWRRWSKLAPGPELSKSERDDPRLEAALSNATDRVFSYIHRSNFATQIGEGLKEFAITAIALKIDAVPGPDIFTCEAVSCAEYAPEVGINGMTPTMWRRPRFRLRELEQRYRGIELNKRLTDEMEKDPGKRIELMEGTVHIPPDGGVGQDRYVGLLLDQKEKDLLWVQELGQTSPWIFTPADQTPGEALGRGPALRVLPDVKTLNKVVEFILRAGAMRVSGLWTSTDESVLSPLTMRVFPGAVIPVESNDQKSPSLRGVEFPGNPDFAQLILADMRQNVRASFFINEMRPDGPVRSATELAIQDRELLQDSGTEFGRLDNEFGGRVMERVWSLLRARGKVPAVAIDGRRLAVEPQSPLSRAQDSSDLLAMSQGLEMIASFFGQEALMLGLKVEDVPEEIWRKVGADMNLVRNKEERDVMQKQAAQIVTSQQQDVAAGAAALAPGAAGLQSAA